MNKEIEFLLKVVKEAGEISKESFTVSAKDDRGDLVTNLDVKIEEYLIGEIKKNYPGFSIVSEEKNSEKEVTDNCFIIDPIDGTINFANGLPLWGIQIACKVGGKTVASVINMVAIGELYWADETGAYLNGKKISVRQVPIKNALYTIDGSKNSISAMQNMLKHSYSKRVLGAVCVSNAFVACGRIHGTVYRNDKPWDYEPGLFIVQKAGGVIANEPGFHASAMNQDFLDILRMETFKKSDKRNIFVLHSLNGDTLNIWGKDVAEYASCKEIKCFLPSFPIRAESRYEKFDEILSEYLKNGSLNENSIVICHSIGNAYFIRFAREHNFVPVHYIAVAPGAVYKYPTTRTDYIVEVKNQAYLKQADLDYAKNFKNVYCFHSDEDDKNEEKFTRFISDTNAKDIYLKGYNHFDGYHRIYKIPELLELLEKLI